MGQNEIVFDRLWYPLSILLLAAIGAKLIGPHGGLQVDKQKSLSCNGLREITQLYYIAHVLQEMETHVMKLVKHSNVAKFLLFRN